MVDRYIEIMDIIGDLPDPDFIPLLLSPGENATVQQLHKKLQDLNSITMELQKDDMDLSKVRKLFNAVVEEDNVEVSIGKF